MKPVIPYNAQKRVRGVFCVLTPTLAEEWGNRPLSQQARGSKSSTDLPHQARVVTQVQRGREETNQPPLALSYENTEKWTLKSKGDGFEQMRVGWADSLCRAIKLLATRLATTQWRQKEGWAQWLSGLTQPLAEWLHAGGCDCHLEKTRNIQSDDNDWVVVSLLKPEKRGHCKTMYKGLMWMRTPLTF